MIVYLSGHEPTSEEVLGAHVKQEKRSITHLITVSSWLPHPPLLARRKKWTTQWGDFGTYGGSLRRPTVGRQGDLQ